MDSSIHPTLAIIKVKAELDRSKKHLRNQHPDWTEKQTSTIAEWDLYFARWRNRFRENIPYSILASLGALSFLKDSQWYEPTLATFLSQWSDLTVYIFRALTLGIFEWAGVHVPTVAIDYLTVGVGMAGITINTISDIQMIKKCSVFDEEMSHFYLTSGCFGFFLWLVFAPIMAPFWPMFFVIPIASMFSKSLASKWGIQRSQLAKIQLKRVLMHSEPFVVSLLAWILFLLFS